MKQPSIGRIVHYNDDGRCLPAIITEVAGGAVALVIFNPNGLQFALGVEEDTVKEGILVRRVRHATWHWPERVE